MNLLTDQIIRVETLDGLHRRLSLPRVYEELLCDNIASFTAQRSHQFHPWRGLFWCNSAYWQPRNSGTCQ